MSPTTSEMTQRFTSTLRAVSLGLAGAFAAGAIGLPAAPLIGASLTVSVAAWAGAKLALPNPLRNAGFLGIGLSLGSGVGPEALAHLGDWAISLGALALSLALTMAACAVLLQRAYRYDYFTALLGATPGTMSYALAVAGERGGDVTAVLVLQSLRLLALATGVPLAVFLWMGGAGATQAPAALALLPLGILALCGMGMALGLERLKTPAAWLVGGFLTSALAHGSGLATGVLPPNVAFACFTITGTLIGTRFSGLAPSALRLHLRAALVAVVLASLISAGFALLVARLTGLPLAQVWIALAPGGVEAMAAIGLALGYDPAFIAAHHFARILILMVLVPLFTRRE